MRKERRNVTLDHEYIMSSCYGFIEEISIKPNSRIYEWEELFKIRTDDGNLITVRVGLSGEVKSLEVQKGDRVIPGLVLAYIKEDLFATASE